MIARNAKRTDRCVFRKSKMSTATLRASRHDLHERSRAYVARGLVQSDELVQHGQDLERVVASRHVTGRAGFCLQRLGRRVVIGYEVRSIAVDEAEARVAGIVVEPQEHVV